MSKVEVTQQPAMSAKEAAFHAEQPLTDDDPVAICRVLVSGPYGGVPDKPSGNVIAGDRISLDPREAAWHQRHGRLVVEISQVRPSELKAAGGVNAYLEANPKKDKLDSKGRSKLPKTHGIPSDEERQYPWEFERVDP